MHNIVVFVFIIAVGIIVAPTLIQFVLGWLLKGVLPQRPKLRHIIAGVVVCIVLIAIAVWAYFWLELNTQRSAVTPTATPTTTPTATSTPTASPTATPTETPIPNPSARIIEEPTFKFVEGTTKLEVCVKVMNTGNTSLIASMPPPGYTYREGEIFQQSVAGTFRVGVDYAHRERNVIEYPYRWGLGRTLQPGQSTTVIGFIELKTSRRSDYWVGLVQEGVRWFETGVERRSIVPPTEEFIEIVMIVVVIVAGVVVFLKIGLGVYSWLLRVCRSILDRPKRGRDIAKLKETISNHLRGSGIVCEFCLSSWSKLGYDVISELNTYDVEHPEVKLGTFTPPRYDWEVEQFEDKIYNHLRRNHFSRGRIPCDTVHFLYCSKNP